MQRMAYVQSLHLFLPKNIDNKDANIRSAIPTRLLQTDFEKM